MECLVLPLHDKLEEWKKMVVNLDKEHSKGKKFSWGCGRIVQTLIRVVVESRVQESEGGYQEADGGGAAVAKESQEDSQRNGRQPRSRNELDGAGQ